jgi:hypothetical protein
MCAQVISRQATINIGTIGHVAHGKSTTVKAVSGVYVRAWFSVVCMHLHVVNDHAVYCTLNAFPGVCVCVMHGSWAVIASCVLVCRRSSTRRRKFVTSRSSWVMPMRRFTSHLLSAWLRVHVCVCRVLSYNAVDRCCCVLQALGVHFTWLRMA